MHIPLLRHRWPALMMSSCASTKIQRDPRRPGQVSLTVMSSVDSSLLLSTAKVIFESRHLASTRRDQSIVGGAADLLKFKDQYTEGSGSQIFKCLQSYKFYKVLPHESWIQTSRTMCLNLRLLHAHENSFDPADVSHLRLGEPKTWHRLCNISDIWTPSGHHLD